MGWAFVLSGFLIILLMMLLLTETGWHWFYIAITKAKRDFYGVIAYLKLVLLVRIYKRKDLTIGDIFHGNAIEFPDKLAIVSQFQSWTFREVNEYSDRIANLFIDHGYRKGNTIALLLENRAEFVGIWLGLSNIGVIIPLINTNFKGSLLLYSIIIAQCSALIYGEAFINAVEDILNELPSNVTLYQLNNQTNFPVQKNALDLTTLLESTCKNTIPALLDVPYHHDKLLYIYTAGLSGIPEVTVITHARYLYIAASLHFSLGFKLSDVFYSPLPLYHTAGGIMSIGQSVLFGSTVAIRKKFNASAYFADCINFNATVAQYIGEMARDILATPASDNDHNHKIRLVYGSGMRSPIWVQFMERFYIPKIGEGNNIIRSDEDTVEPIRGHNGFCQLCEPNEPGIFIGQMIKSNPSQKFMGYTEDQLESVRKIVRNIFQKGDMAYNSDHLIGADGWGYVFIKNRENVSARQIEAQMSKITGHRDIMVYGVTLPNNEERASMAAILDLRCHVNYEIFVQQLAKELPGHIKPKLLRFITKINFTGSHKVRKYYIQTEGYNPNHVTDLLYYLTPEGKYERLTQDIYNSIMRYEIQF